MNERKFSEDTIAAIATGVAGSISIIRLSGAKVLEIAGRVWRGRRELGACPPRSLELGRLVNDRHENIDQCLVAWMPAPHSYTGEDVVEFHTHGGPLVAKAALAMILKAGARHAEPGEFTKRAFLNGKLDLTQAEAVADIIAAQSEMALHTANRQLEGRLGRQVNQLYDRLTEILGEIEARLDFVDEELDWRSTSQLQADLETALASVAELLKFREEGEILRHGIRLVIAGAPNAGKSSLLNLILGQDRAIVTDIPGTTRDTLEELVHIRGIPVRLIDTAGIHGAPANIIEHQGVERSYSSIASAQIILWVLDSTRALAEQPLDPKRLEGKGVIVIANKTDLEPSTSFAAELERPVLPLCAISGAGFDALLDAIEDRVWGHPHHEEPEVAVNARHSALLEETAGQLRQARELLPGEEYELIAVNLRAAIDALGKITGRTVHPDILDYIFSTFCIGK